MQGSSECAAAVWVPIRTQYLAATSITSASGRPSVSLPRVTPWSGISCWWVQCVFRTSFQSC